MGDFVKSELTREGGMYPQLADARCAGCGQEIADDAGCYAQLLLIWHSQCWPRRDFVVYTPRGAQSLPAAAPDQPEGRRA